MFGTSSQYSFQHHAEGFWGDFKTPTGRVRYIQTRARLGREPNDESRLMKALSPVREVLPVEELDFNQLLQRDLDDHRVATELLPYILRQDPSGPAFFPPLLAVLLPFDGQFPEDKLPTAERTVDKQLESYPTLSFRESRYGDSFCFQMSVDAEGAPHRVPFGRLLWNKERCKPVVLDGQHRAMSLLAINRTLNNEWEDSGGARHRHFYVKRVKQLLERIDLEDDGQFVPSELVVPVVICWFPDYQDRNPHKAARKLFVDVNKNARQPSEARLILLSDTRLTNIFTRALLNRLREPNPPLPLFAVEYDDPSESARRPVRWSVLSNINILKELVQITTFGPKKYIANVEKKFRGRPPWRSMNPYMRSQLQLEDILPTRIQEDDYSLQRSSLGNETFPQANKNAQARIVSQFMDIWGEPILKLLGELLFYNCHAQAIKRLNNEWSTSGSEDSLARDALFEGVGMYWTLRDSKHHWEDQQAAGLAMASDQPKVVDAWDILQEKKDLFEKHRAEAYLNSRGEAAVEACNELFRTVNTFACQIGAVLTISTAVHKAPGTTDGLSPAIATTTIVRGWNASLQGEVAKGRTRKLIFNRSVAPALNSLPKLSRPSAIYFRYFFLELLLAPEAQEQVDSLIDMEAIRDARDNARRSYFEKLRSERAKALRKTNPTWSRETRLVEAHDEAMENLRTALDHWFAIDQASFMRWREGKIEEPGLSDVPESGDDPDSDDYGYNEADEEFDEVVSEEVEDLELGEEE